MLVKQIKRTSTFTSPRTNKCTHLSINIDKKKEVCGISYIFFWQKFFLSVTEKSHYLKIMIIIIWQDQLFFFVDFLFFFFFVTDVQTVL